MAENALLVRYERFEERIQELPPLQRGFTLGSLWFLVWFGMSLWFGGSPLWSAILQAIVGAVVFGGLEYWRHR